MPISVKIDGLDKLTGMADNVARARVRFLDGMEHDSQAFSLDSVARAKRDYLSGPRPGKLGVVTGRLRSSISGEVRRDNSSFTTTVGTNVKYAAIHELGFTGSIQVPAHVRVVSKVFGRSVEARISAVRAHSRRIQMPARPFIQPAITEALPGLEDSIKRRLAEVTLGSQ